MPNIPMLSRRAAFAALSVPAVGALTGVARAAPPADANGLRDVCFLTPQSIEGPFYLDPRLVRAEIAEGRAGVPLRVDLRVIDGATCKPSERARVDIWHADAKGIYSGYEGQGDKQELSTAGQKFLRHAIHRQRRRGEFPDDLSRLVRGPRHAYAFQGAAR